MLLGELLADKKDSLYAKTKDFNLGQILTDLVDKVYPDQASDADPDRLASLKRQLAEAKKLGDSEEARELQAEIDKLGESEDDRGGGFERSMIVGASKEGRAEQRSELEAQYPDYSPARHDAFVIRYNKEVEKRKQDSYRKNRGIDSKDAYVERDERITVNHGPHEGKKGFVRKRLSGTELEVELDEGKTIKIDKAGVTKDAEYEKYKVVTVSGEVVAKGLNQAEAQRALQKYEKENKELCKIAKMSQDAQDYYTEELAEGGYGVFGPDSSEPISSHDDQQTAIKTAMYLNRREESDDEAPDDSGIGAARKQMSQNQTAKMVRRSESGDSASTCDQLPGNLTFGGKGYRCVKCGATSDKAHTVHAKVGHTRDEKPSMKLVMGKYQVKNALGNVEETFVAKYEAEEFLRDLVDRWERRGKESKKTKDAQATKPGWYITNEDGNSIFAGPFPSEKRAEDDLKNYTRGEVTYITEYQIKRMNDSKDAKGWLV